MYQNYIKTLIFGVSPFTFDVIQPGHHTEATLYESIPYSYKGSRDDGISFFYSRQHVRFCLHSPGKQEDSGTRVQRASAHLISVRGYRCGISELNTKI